MLKSFYFDAVDYNNIISDIIILALIKEGEKLMELIKCMFWRRFNTSDITVTSPTNIFIMRQWLIIFQISLDQLFDKILEKLCADITLLTEKKLFDTKVEKMLEYLDSSEYDGTYDEFESSAYDNVFDLVGSGENIPFADKFYFDEYSFVFPLMHVYEFTNLIDNII